ncbi:MAG: carbohydrate binding domain-containing protein, partial [Thermoproteota archaeon]
PTPISTPAPSPLPTQISEALGSQIFSFHLPWNDIKETVVSLSGLVEKPAGKFGHIYVGDDGHIYAGGKRIKFLGVNICGAAAFPEKSDADKIAARLSKFGVNIVRFHHMDANWEGFNIFDRSYKDTRHLNSEALDRLDYFIAKLKENGIYTDLNLLVSRRFRAEDGLPKEIDLVDWKDQQALGFFVDEVEKLEKEYAEQLLTHFNPYTGMTYAEDPAIAFIEIVNEQGLIQSWLGGTIDKLPEVFKERLREKWNSYLLSKYGSDEGLLDTWIEGENVSPVEVLRNGCFEQELSGWNVEVHDGAQALYKVVYTPVGRALEIEVFKKGSADWHVQFNQPGLKVSSGEIYFVRFKARAEDASRVSIGFVQAHDPWRTISQRIEVELTQDWRDYEIAIPISESDNNARFDVTGLARTMTKYQFSCFSVKLFKGYGFMDGESIERASVQVFSLSDFWKRSSAARMDWVEFLYSLEERFFTKMQRYIKDELKAKALIIGTIIGCSTPNIMSKLDVVDTHSYWMHPAFPGSSWDPVDWYVINAPMVNDPRGSTVAGLAVKRVLNKPLTVSEYNHPAPNMYDAETVLTLATYAALQDWDGVFLFAYGSPNDWNSRRIRGFFDIDQHPIKMATMIPAYLIFLRGDLRSAEKIVTAGLSKQDEIDLVAGGRIHAWNLPDASHKGLDPSVSLVHRIAIVTEGPGNISSVEESGQIYCSDTGEIVWNASDPTRGLIIVNSSRSIVIIGFGGGKRFDFGSVSIQTNQTLLDGWCVLTLSVMDGDDFSSWNRILLVAAGYVTNTRMRLRTYDNGKGLLTWSARNLTKVEVYKGPVTCGNEWGNSPSLVEGILATVSLRVSRNIEVWALDNVGDRVRQVPVFRSGDWVTFVIGPGFKTIWYEIVAKDMG